MIELPQRLLHLLGLRREEFEADLDVAARFGEQRQVAAEALEGVHAALRCGTAAFDAAPQGDGQLAALEMLDLVDLEPGGREPAGHHLVLEAEADVGVALAQLLALVRREIDDQQGAAGREHPRRLGDRRGRRVGIMKHLVDDDAVGALVGERQRVHVALAKARRECPRLRA